MTVADTVRVVAAVARVTSLIASDDVPGQWWIKDPIDRAMQKYRDRRSSPVLSRFTGEHLGHSVFDEPWWWKYRAGLSCPYCVSVHVAFWTVLIENATRHAPKPIRGAWKLATGALAAAWVAGHAEAYLSGGDDE